ncbi:MAG: hypothetical protein ABSF23_10520 [Terracidiphilus sp.]|jgi:hypothetical protein
MVHAALMMFGPEFGLWMFLSVGAVALFVVFIPLVSWIDSRRKEREAFYKSETLRRLGESSTDGAKLTLDMLREEARREEIKKREGLKVAGLINIGVGVGLVIFLRGLIGGGHDSPYLCGLIPGLIGVAMLIYVYLLAAPIE